MDVIEVKNKHPHLDSVTLSKLFKPGFSTKSMEGRGYGLSNIKNIISNNGGELNIQNETIDEENYLVFKVLII